MSDYVRTITITAAAGAFVAGCLALPAFLPPAFADQQPAKTLLSSASDLFPDYLDTDAFVKYDIILDETVSTDVQSTQTVKKIGFGKATKVTIVTTPTGTYSSDAIVSPHVRYPGIEVERVPDWIAHLRGHFRHFHRDDFGRYFSGSFVILVAPDRG